MDLRPSQPDAKAWSRDDGLSLVSGTSQNILGIGVAGIATFIVQVLMTRVLGSVEFGVVTLCTQAAFLASFVTRAGMDMAVLRDVAIDVGMNRHNLLRGAVARAAAIAAGVSTAIAVVAIGLAEPIQARLGIPESTRWAVYAAAIGVPFIALTNVWLAATRGLKIMRYTLYVFWAGQNVAWIVLMLLLWVFSASATTSVLAYSLSWACAAVAAFYFWREESRQWKVERAPRGWLNKLMRYAGPRAPASLLAQLLFWADLFILTRYASTSEVGVYSAALRAGQVMMLFLTSVSLMFAPYVADLYNRGQHERLDALYKLLTRWVVGATLPLFLLVAVTPGSVMRVFGADFASDQSEVALLILLLGQFANIASGSAGFILIMVGRTGADLTLYVASLLLDVTVALALTPHLGMRGAAIANAVTFACSNTARLLLVQKFVRIQPYDRRYVRLLLPTLVGAVAMTLAHKLSPGGYLIDLIATGSSGVICYGLAYFLFATTSGERRALNSLVVGLKVRLRGD
jgi:O-antigen/teichoic acid export membrane protein